MNYTAYFAPMVCSFFTPPPPLPPHTHYHSIQFNCSQRHEKERQTFQQQQFHLQQQQLFISAPAEVGTRPLAYLHTSIRISKLSASCFGVKQPPPFPSSPLLAPLPASCPAANPYTKYRLRLNFGHEYLIFFHNYCKYIAPQNLYFIALEVSHPDMLA